MSPATRLDCRSDPLCCDARHEGDTSLRRAPGGDPAALSYTCGPSGSDGVMLLENLRVTGGSTRPLRLAVHVDSILARAAFDAAIAAEGAALFADVPNYTDITPILQVSELAAA